AETIIIDANGTGDYPTIQAAIDDSNDGDVVELQQGTYTGVGNRSIDFLGKAITVRSINPEDPCVVASTVIDCQGAGCGFYFDNGEDANSILAGLTITNGYLSKGGGIYCYDYSSPKISHCRIVGNSASFRGGGICSDMSNMIIENCTIIGNSVNNPNYIGAGGGIYCGGGGRGYPMIINCLITNNSAAGSAVVDKDVGGGIYLTAEHATIRNCTIVRNSAEYCGGIGINQYRTATISNCILWDNSDSYISGNPIVSYSDVQGGFLGTGNINADPLFVNPATGDYHLSEASPCRDSGDPFYIRTSGETDIDGEPRVMGICVDMGADEFTDEVLAMPIIEISSTEFVFSSYEGGPNPDAQILSIRNVGLGTLYWRIIKYCSWLEVVPTHGESTGDVNEVTLSVDISGLNWGSYTCELMIIPDRAANGPQTITVNLYIRRELPLEVPSEYGTIQAAIDATVPGDTVVVMQGTYNENINLNGKNIILTSTNPNNPVVVAGTVIQGDGTTSVVTFSGSEDTSCELTGFTITGGHTNDPQHGGGIRGNGMTAKISNCHITGNSAYRRGGGLFDCDGPVTSCTISGNTVTPPATTEGAGLHSCDGPISNCTISNNSSGSITQSGRGGGLYSCHGPITNCTITGNSAGGNGGGLYECDGPISNCTIVGNIAQHNIFQCRGGGLSDCDGAISNCIISDNVAGESGGGLNRCRGVISDCRISGNTAIEWGGGGLKQCHGSIINCTIIGNSASGSGGGLSWCESIRNCIISNNWTGENGGGLYDCTGPVNCTISGNRANGNGGGIYYRGSDTKVANCILWDNRATKGNEIYLDVYIVCGKGGCSNFPSSMSVRYSNVQGGETAAYIEPECTLNWGLGNIDADPCFASPGYWNDNGTPTDANDDFCVEGDYHLLAESRVIGGRIDIGADEFYDGCFPPGHPDFAQWLAVGMPECWCNPRQCHGDADGLAGGGGKCGYYYVGPTDLNILISGWLVTEPPHGLGIATIPNGICADVAHDLFGSPKTGFYRVGPSDLNILIANWLIKYFINLFDFYWS
ncbi:MAG: right-handed parallel beta-helix repeat-containing protein, partial [Planctomycetota bacterium]